MIKLKNISKNFYLNNKKIEVLKDLSFSLNKGESLSIVGPSGSGKTTLLSIISGLDKPSSGLVEINNTDITKLDEAGLTNFRGKEIGIVFQTFHLINYMTAKENIEIVYRLQDKEVEVESLLDSVGLSERIHHFPYTMSGGECQRLAIARAIAGKPNIIIADEPSGNLDRETGKIVMDILFNLVDQHNITLILVTHDLELASRTQKRMKIDGGKLYED